MGIKEILERWKERRTAKGEKFNQMLEEYRMQKKLVELEKSSNERELERFMKEEREDNIKKELEEFRRKRKVQGESNKILETKNMFAGSGNEILHNDNNMLKRIKTERGIFFK